MFLRGMSHEERAELIARIDPEQDFKDFQSEEYLLLRGEPPLYRGPRRSRREPTTTQSTGGHSPMAPSELSTAASSPQQEASPDEEHGRGGSDAQRHQSGGLGLFGLGARVSDAPLQRLGSLGGRDVPPQRLGSPGALLVEGSPGPTGGRGGQGGPRVPAGSPGSPGSPSGTESDSDASEKSETTTDVFSEAGWRPMRNSEKEKLRNSAKVSEKEKMGGAAKAGSNARQRSASLEVAPGGRGEEILEEPEGSEASKMDESPRGSEVSSVVDESRGARSRGASWNKLRNSLASLQETTSKLLTKDGKLIKQASRHQEDLGDVQQGQKSHIYEEGSDDYSDDGCHENHAKAEVQAQEEDSGSEAVVYEVAFDLDSADAKQRVSCLRWSFDDMGAYVNRITKYVPEVDGIAPGDRLVSINGCDVRLLKQASIQDVWGKAQTGRNRYLRLTLRAGFEE